MSSVADPKNLSISSSPERATASGPFYAIIPPGVEVRAEPPFERAEKICQKAAARGGLGLTLARLMVIQNEITALRKRFGGQNQSPPYPQVIWNGKRPKLDIYEVTIEAGRHLFLWDRKHARVLSYIGPSGPRLIFMNMHKYHYK